jgi:Ni/Co efflux regulator RcnB
MAARIAASSRELASPAREGKRSNTSLSSSGLRGAASSTGVIAASTRKSSTGLIRREFVNLPRPWALDIFRAHQNLVVTFSNNSQGVYMSKLLSVLIAAAFATVSVGSIAASHGGAAKDDKKMEKKEEMKKDDKKPEAKKDDKKPEAKKDDKKPEMKKDEKKPEAKKEESKKDDKKPAEAKKEEPKK